MDLKIFIVVGASLLGGCSFEASIQSLSSDINTISQKATSSEVTPASKQGVFTTKGYEVQTSVSYYSAPAEVTTAQGYTVNMNVQSTLYKE
ncbi:hypothetical protein [Bdellovibrio bacteriovorus]|uniref:hypothetical protein n=1 Tax=Bdellovibrio bacteriovorus TaxID=959 RepID=UPI0035A636BE